MDIKFIDTNDGSIGLYDNNINDIYHSQTGAYKEAVDKFVLPLNFKKNFKNKININILDICYGIGYNTKAFLNEYHNLDKSINIDCLEYEDELIFLSTIIKDNINNIELKLFLLSQFLSSAQLQINFTNFINKYNKDIFIDFLDVNILKFINFLHCEGYINDLAYSNYEFLHNIYYKYISNSTLNIDNATNYKDIRIKYYTGDARININSLNKYYDIVFLDAFSPQKDPTLWTYDFLLKVVLKMNENSILVSYSKSTPFRNTLLNLGLNVGKTFLEGIDMGTIASFDKQKILNSLSEFDYKLLETKSGIMYRDESQTSSATEILNKRKNEQDNSTLLSHTKFLKLYENRHKI